MILTGEASGRRSREKEQPVDGRTSDRCNLTDYSSPLCQPHSNYYPLLGSTCSPICNITYISYPPLTTHSLPYSTVETLEAGLMEGILSNQNRFTADHCLAPGTRHCEQNYLSERKTIVTTCTPYLHLVQTRTI